MPPGSAAQILRDYSQTKANKAKEERKRPYYEKNMSKYRGNRENSTAAYQIFNLFTMQGWKIYIPPLRY